MKQGFKAAASGVFAMALALGAVPTASAQTVTAVPTLDLNQFTGTWYVIAQYPAAKPKKQCAHDAKVLYALDDKKNSFQMGSFCRLQTGKLGEVDAKGTMDKAGDGKLRLSRLVFLHTPHWVLATGPGYSWALVGNPNRKTLTVLSRSMEMEPGTLAEVESKAAAQGYDAAKLIRIPQTPSTM